jgi:hypothetical protein
MKYTAVAVLFAFLAWTSMASANVTGVNLADDGDGVITCQPPEDVIWNDSAGEVVIHGIHNMPNGHLEAGHIIGEITTDETDPTLMMMNSIDNDTGIAWAAYHVNVSMSGPFTISGDYVTTPADWSSNITSQPVDMGGGVYVGQIDYTGGAPLPDGGTLDFGYAITFGALPSFEFCQEMIPVAVPEPATLVLVGCGLVGLFVLRRRSA